MQRARDWMREAQAELEAARDLYRGGHWSWCCFTCQQAAEKAPFLEEDARQALEDAEEVIRFAERIVGSA